MSVVLIERLRQLAKRQNRSLNNYVETLLLEAAYWEPNDETLAAMKEAESGYLRSTRPLDRRYGTIPGIIKYEAYN